MSCKNVANYLQRISNQGYLVAQTVQQEANNQSAGSGRCKLPHGRGQWTHQARACEGRRKETNEAVQIADEGTCNGVWAVLRGRKREARGVEQLGEDLEQHSLHEFIHKIERICVGFDDHKQEVLNLVQALKMLFLYTQN